MISSYVSLISLWLINNISSVSDVTGKIQNVMRDLRPQGSSQISISIRKTPNKNEKSKTSDSNHKSNQLLTNKYYTCTFCKRTFSFKASLNQHVQSHCRLNPTIFFFHCSFCPYSSTYKANMERHIRNLHNSGAAKHRCNLCNFRSNYKYCIRRHMLTFHKS